MTVFNKQKWIMTALRRVSYRYPPRNAAKIAARKERGKYECADCRNLYGPKEIQLDHVTPVISEEGFEDWNCYIERLFCDYAGYQVLCSECHQKKTNEENETRRLNKVSKNVKIKE